MAVLINVGQNATAFGNALELPAKYQNNLLVNREVIWNQMSMLMNVGQNATKINPASHNNAAAPPAKCQNKYPHLEI